MDLLTRFNIKTVYLGWSTGGDSCEYVLVKVVRWFQWLDCGTLSLRSSFLVGVI